MSASTKRNEKNLRPQEDQPRIKAAERGDSSSGQRRVRLSLFGIIGLCLVGLADMIYLTYLHWQVHSVPGFTGGFCPGGSDAVDCDAVAASPYSELFSVPVSFWGVLAYLVLIGIAVWGLKATGKQEPHRGAGLGLLSGAAAGALGVSALLGYISHRFIESFCSLCMFGYIINIGIAVAVAVSLHALGKGPIKALFDDLSFFLTRPRYAASFGGGGAILAALTMLLYPSPQAAADEGEADSLKVQLASGKVPVGDPDIRDLAFCAKAPYKGTADAPVVIVEFTDYQCGFCRRSHMQLDSLLEPYEGLYRVIHRHFPLDGQCNDAVARPGNGRSCAAAAHAICAHEQGLFWELNALLYRSRRPLDGEVIRTLAKQAGCDIEALDACLESDVPKEQLARDTSAGIELGVRGTPTLFINGTEVVGIPSPEVLESFFGSVSEET